MINPRDYTSHVKTNDLEFPALKTKIFLVPVNCYDNHPGGQGTFYNGHKITVVIWPVGFSKDLSTLDVKKVISQVSSQTKQVEKLHMPIKHVHKSLASINEKRFFYVNFVC